MRVLAFLWLLEMILIETILIQAISMEMILIQMILIQAISIEMILIVMLQVAQMNLFRGWNRNFLKPSRREDDWLNSLMNGRLKMERCQIDQKKSLVKMTRTMLMMMITIVLMMTIKLWRSLCPFEKSPTNPPTIPDHFQSLIGSLPSTWYLGTKVQARRSPFPSL